MVHNYKQINYETKMRAFFINIANSLCIYVYTYFAAISVFKNIYI